MEEFTIRTTINAQPAELYEIWMNSEKHAALTDSPAHLDPSVGGKFSVWDNYITGTNLELIPNHKIMQKWRTTEFPADAPDSILEISFQAMNGQTLVVIHHHGIPDNQASDYKQGWQDYYLSPLKKIFPDQE